MLHQLIRSDAVLFSACSFLFLAPLHARAHCDSLDGPVVHDARLALDKGDPTPVLKWVTEDSEKDILDAFKRTVAVRKSGGEAQALADQFFFETLVRIHRAGEGEAFTGLKPSSSIDPGIAAADEALLSGTGQQLAKELSTKVSAEIQARYSAALERKKHAGKSVAEGRKFVEAYVAYIHFVESIYRIALHGVTHLHHEAEASIE